jgi:sulfur-carrier protein adenylyltransferase/sulfurtransferase
MRYQRQEILKEIGEQGQRKLAAAQVLVVGAGGLGCPVLQYLVGAGVGHIGIADFDWVALENLHRQVLYTMEDIGHLKAKVAQKHLVQLNPEVSISVFDQRLDALNAENVLRSYDLVIDGTDNFATRYLLSDACYLMDKPLIFGAISRFEGQVGLFDNRAGAPGTKLSYRDLFPVPPSETEVPSCSEAGVLGVLPGIIGTLMASEALKFTLGIGETLVGKVYTCDILNNRNYTLELTPRPDTRSRIPRDLEELRKTDYEGLCGPREEGDSIPATEFNRMLKIASGEFIDVREHGELPLVKEFDHLAIPLSQLEFRASEVQGNPVVVFCQTGARSRQAARILSGIFGTSKRIFRLEGGIQQWKQQQSNHGQ